MSTRTSSRSARARSSLLQDMLLARRQALVASIRERLSSVREDRSRADHVTALDDGEVCDLDVQEDVELALVQMERETLVRLDAALTRLDNGLYGRCIDCADEISESRLKAQFTAMETALNNSQTQQAWLTSQISSLPTLG